MPLTLAVSYLKEACRAALEPGQKTLPAESPIVTRFSPSNVNLHRRFLKIIEAENRSHGEADSGLQSVLRDRVAGLRHSGP